MSYSSLKWPIFLILSSLLHAALGEDITCENLPTNMCAFSISASGKRCLLETANVAGEYSCRTSAVEVEGIVNHVESDECVAACGVDRKTVGISSDALMEAGFAAKLCSPACLDYCPNILDLYFNLAAGEGAFLPDLCDAQRANPHRSMLEILSSSGAAPGPVSDIAPGPVSDIAPGPVSDIAPGPVSDIAPGPVSEDIAPGPVFEDISPGPVSDSDASSPALAPAPM